jgi:hypothetical protein
MAWMIALAAATALTTAQYPARTAPVDADRDGLNDRLEQRLIERFQPRLHVSTSDCAERPSAFAANAVQPTPTTKDGTIYARAFPVDRAGESGGWIEVQYFHLWAHDCGWNSHPLDVEHVSVLLRAYSREAAAEAWTARYWYAAAHQDTICDASHGARAESLDATDRGAKVWVARGKHASYLTPSRCRWGCGTDRCPDSVALEPATVVNLGERSAPMNGAVWVTWAGWPLGLQMRSDFTPDVVARLDRTEPGQIVAVHDVGRAMKAFLLGSGAGALGLVETQHTARAALGATFRGIGRAVKRTGRAVIGR